MKSAFVLLFALAVVLFSSGAFAVNSDSLRTEVICEDGMKFLVVFSTLSSSSPSVVQILRGNGKPSLCNQAQKKLWQGR